MFFSLPLPTFEEEREIYGCYCVYAYWAPRRYGKSPLQFIGIQNKRPVLREWGGVTPKEPLPQLNLISMTVSEILSLSPMPKGKSLGSPRGEEPCVSTWGKDVRCWDQKTARDRLCFPKMVVFHSTCPSSSVTGHGPNQGWCQSLLSLNQGLMMALTNRYGGCDSMAHGWS